jgi:tetratricopeptide (TPR) repeat protein
MAGSPLRGPLPLAHPLSYIRAERGWTYQDLVDAVARRVGNMSARREKAWRWEHRGVIPDRETQEALADELGVPRAALDALGWPAWLPAGERDALRSPWTLDGCVAALEATAGSALLDRRGFLVSGDGSAVTAAQEWLALAPRGGTDGGTGDGGEGTGPPGDGRTGDGVVEGLEQRLPALRRMERALGGGRVRTVADAELQLVADLIARGPGADRRPGAGGMDRRLFAVAAELGRLAGWASLDCGYQAAAERYLLTGLSAAHAAADRALGANILKSLSLLYLDADRPAEALALARTARSGAPDAPALVSAMLAVHQARTHAALGQVAECEALLRDAGSAVALAADQPVPPWAEHFNEAEYCAQAAACHALLDRFDSADPLLRRALALHPPGQARDRVTCLVWAAECALGLGDTARASALAKEATDLASDVESLRARRRLAALQHRLRRRG